MGDCGLTDDINYAYDKYDENYFSDESDEYDECVHCVASELHYRKEFYFACIDGDLKQAKYIYNKCREICCLNGVLSETFSNGHLKVVKWLLTIQDEYELFKFSCQSGDYALIKWLAPRVDPDIIMIILKLHVNMVI